MKYTKEQLQAMSDKEINTALATLVFDSQGAPYVINQKVTLNKVDKLRQDCLGHELYPHAIDVVCGFGMRIDYCNTPNDIMPLAFANEISIVCERKKDGTPAYVTVVGVENVIGWREFSGPLFADINPLRAIACCLILALQEQ